MTNTSDTVMDKRLHGGIVLTSCGLAAALWCRSPAFRRTSAPCSDSGDSKEDLSPHCTELVARRRYRRGEAAEVGVLDAKGVSQRFAACFSSR